MIEAKIICDSISPAGKRLTTFQNRNPKFIHGEFMTHRVISRNASSSRAIPVKKLIEEVRSDALRAAPIFWGKNQAGMQAVEELSDAKIETNGLDVYGPKVSMMDLAKSTWKGAAFWAAGQAEAMHQLGVHKQIVNRILEPFSHINVVATATEWDNFFGLRLHKDAQPEMRALAEAMWAARQASTPQELKPGEWHLPFVTEKDRALAKDYSDASAQAGHPANRWVEIEDVLRRVSVARCARVSYQSFETGKVSTVEEDLALYDKLTAGLTDPTQPLHASPMEHQATPDEPDYYRNNDGPHDCPDCGTELWKNKEQWGNLIGWRQFRKMLPNEARAPLPEGYVK